MYTQDTIDAYVKGKLTAEERVAFEAEMAQDESLADAVAQAKVDLEVANLLIRDEVRDWMKEWESEEQDSGAAPPLRSSGPNPKLYYWMAAAAALVLLIAAVWLFTPKKATLPTPIAKDDPKPIIDQPDPEDNDEEKTEASEPDPAIPTSPRQPASKKPKRLLALASSNFQYQNTETYLRKGSSDQPTPPSDSVDLAIQSLKAGNTQQAIVFANTVEASSMRYADAQLLLGQIYFETKQYARAQKAYERAIATGNIGRDLPEWNLLMTLIAQYDRKKVAADALLEKVLSDQDHTYYEDAVELEREMSKL